MRKMIATTMLTLLSSLLVPLMLASPANASGACKTYPHGIGGHMENCRYFDSTLRGGSLRDTWSSYRWGAKGSSDSHYIDGVVKDTVADGKCAFIRGVKSSSQVNYNVLLAHACGKGKKQLFGRTFNQMLLLSGTFRLKLCVSKWKYRGRRGCITAFTQKIY